MSPWMNRLLRGAAVTLPLCAAAADGPAPGDGDKAADATEWITLFDGRTLKGWQVKCLPADRDRAFWKVDDGAIHCDSAGHRDHDYIWLLSDGEYEDFELRLQVRADATQPGNSGIQIRSRYDDEAGWLDGPQCDVHPPGPWRTGLIYDETRGARRWIAPSLPAAGIKPEQGPKEWKWNAEGWNEIEIVCRGWRIATRVNGVAISDFDGAGVLDDAAHRERNVGRRGHIALQLHKKSELKIWFRDIRLRPLPPKAEE